VRELPLRPGTFPLEEGISSLRVAIFPVGGAMLPGKPAIIAVCVAMFPVGVGTFPLQEAIFPVGVGKSSFRVTKPGRVNCTTNCCVQPRSPEAAINAMFGGGSSLRRCYCSGCTWYFERSAREVHHFLPRANIPAFTTKQEAGRPL